MKVAQQTIHQTPPSPGRIVLYTLFNGPSKGQQRPAIIVRTVTNRPDHDTPIVLRVFTDGDVDGVPDHTTGAAYSAELEPGTWSWPPRVGA